ncbi:hypothetical protein DFH06DRAFT_1314792 [Mycena polygramma]|nr:hypothetical protein DFH06DRAFT_1314792 [Mycena polygramma]
MSFEDEPEEQQPTASSSGLNSRRPLSIHPRRPIPPRQSIADMHSWEAPSRDAAVSSTYEYLSALSHGFDSQYSSISDMAHTIASNTTNAPPSPMWGESESPFSTLFARSPGPSPSLAPTLTLIRDRSGLRCRDGTKQLAGLLRSDVFLSHRRIGILRLGTGFLAQLSAQRPHGYQRPRSPDAERRFSLRGSPSSSQAQAPDADPRRFFTSRPTPTSSVTRDPPEPRHERRYSATDMHNVLARQTRLEGSRLAPASPSGYRPSDTDPTDLTPHDGFSMSTSRARQLISRYHSQYHAQAEAEANDFSTSGSPWAALPARRSDPSRAEAEARRRPHRALRGDPAFHAMFGLNGATARFRRRALGDYMRDEDFDASYETLLSLGGIIGEAKAKGTEASVIAGLDAASYKDWATP